MTLNELKKDPPLEALKAYIKYLEGEYPYPLDNEKYSGKFIYYGAGARAVIRNIKAYVYILDQD